MMGAGQQQVMANASPSRSWMQWMHRGAQHARAATVALMMAAEALCTQGGCTLVHRMQWQCGGCCCSWMARTRTSSCLQVAMPHDFAQQPATATVLRRCGLQGHCAPSDSVHWCCARRWALASNRVAAPSCTECSGSSVAAAARGWLALAPARACKWRSLMIVLSSLRQRLCCDAVGCRGTVHLATVCAGAARCDGC